MWPFLSKFERQADRRQSWPPIAEFELPSGERETRQVRDHKLLLQRRVREVAHLFSSSSGEPLDPAKQFRRMELAPEGPGEFLTLLGADRSVRARLVDSICNRRSALISGTPPAADRHGEFLVFDVDETLNGGTAEQASNGFFNVENEPAWETWIDYYEDREIGGRLLCYVPPSLLELAKAGVSANLEQCIHWIVDREIVTEQVIGQRVRNRIIEYLDLTSSFERQREYEANVPIAHVPGEVICQWGDWVDENRFEWYGAPVFSRAEVEAMKKFHTTWELAADCLGGRPRLEEVQRLPEWIQLRDAAAEALSVFSVRGKLPEDEEMSDDA
jgi:hypothetical protein